MAASVIDSPFYAQLFVTGETERLFSDTVAIHRASLEIQIDPGRSVTSADNNDLPVPGLVAVLRAGMNAPEAAQNVHWDATSQDSIDAGLMLRLLQAVVQSLARCGLISRPEARDLSENTPLPVLARAGYPEIAPAATNPIAQPGQTKAGARAFAARAKAL